MTKPSSRGMTLALALAILIATLLSGAQPAQATGCPGAQRLRVPGAEMQKITCAADLTTAGAVAAGLSVQADWNLLNDFRTVNPSGVPGVQIDGYFPDTPPPAATGYTPNPFNGWNHDAQFVIRLPDSWNGKLVVAPPPGNRRQYSSDFVIGDWVLAKGYAYASTDKGNWNANFFLDGANPGDAVAEWHDRVAELTKAARRVVNQRYGRNPAQVYLFGISNGGYQVRYAIENDPGLYDGGVDWEGTLFTADGPNLFTYLPPLLRSYPAYAAAAPGSPAQAAARDALIAAGLPAGSEFLWPLYNQVYWGLTQQIYRLEFDPAYAGAEADYDYASRPQAVKDAMDRVSMTGKIRRPLITVQGTLDSLITPATNAEPYVDLIESQNRSRLHRYYTVESGQHVDGFVPSYGDALRPVLPCARAAFEALEQWVEGKVEPPASGLIGRDEVSTNSCALP